MKRFFSAKTIAAAAVVLGAFGAVTAAHARSDVVFSIGVQVPGAYGYVQPAPVYVQPQPVYVQPQYGYAWGHRGWDRRGPYGDRDRDGIANVYDRDNYRQYPRRHARGPWGDYDRDGVPNRVDHFPGNPYRR